MKSDYKLLPWDITKVFNIFLMAFIACVMVGPFLWMVKNSLQAHGNVYSLAFSFDEFTLNNYVKAWTQSDVGLSFINSLILSSIAIGGNTILGSLAAYPLARYNFKGKNIIFYLFLSGMMIPFQLVMIPLYDMIRTIGLDDHLLGVALPGIVGALSVFMIRQAYLVIPKDLENAARIDGASEFRIWWQIMLPQVKPAVAALSIFIFVASWGDLLWPMIVLQTESKYTLPVKIAFLSGSFSNDLHVLAAACMIIVLPVILLFLFLQRFFIEGLSGSVKG